MRQASKETLFIRKHAKKTPAEIVELGKKAGLTLKTKTVSVVKSNYKAAQAKAKGLPVKPPSGVDKELVKLVLTRGVDRVAAAVRYVQEHVGLQVA